MSLTPPAGGTATTTLANARGKAVELRQYLGGTPTGPYQASLYGYDRLSRPTGLTDAAGTVWTTGYDLRGRVTQAVDPDKGTTTLTYDDAGQLLTATDSRSILLTHTYDVLGRQTALWQGPAGTGTKLSDAVYDSLTRGQLTSSTRYGGGNAYTTATTGYDDRYRPLGMSVTIPIVEGSLAGTWSTGTSYNVDGSVASTSYPAAAGLAAETVTFTYDSTGLPLTATGQDTYVGATAYYPWGEVQQRILGTGTKRVQVNTTVDEATRRLTQNQTKTENQSTPGTWVEQLTENYGYDNAGNVKNITETSGATTVSNQCFGYDALRQLTEAWTTTAATCQAGPSQAVVGGPDPDWTSYRYTSIGLRSQTINHAAGGDTIRTYAYPAATAAQPHTLTSVTASGASTGTSSYGYDPAGNTTTRNVAGQPGQTLTWDAEGHLATLVTGTTSSYLYDAAGHRLIGKDANGTTLYLGHTEIRRDPIGSATATRFYGTAVRTTSGGLAWQCGDHHGTTQLTIDANTLAVTRRKSDPFGTPRGIQPAWPTTRGFVNGTTDPTGLTHLGAREYDPTLGRFVSVDPVFNPADPQSWQGYAYADNTPVTASDPSGTIACVRLDDINGPCASNLKAVRNYTGVPSNPSAPPPGGRRPGDNGSENRGSNGPACARNKCTTTLLNGSVYTVIDGSSGTAYFVNGIPINPMHVKDPLQFAGLYDYYLAKQTGDDPLIRMLGAMSLACQTDGAPAGCSAYFAATLNAAIASHISTTKFHCDESCQQFAQFLLVMGAAGAGAIAARFPAAGSRFRGGEVPCLNSFEADTRVLMADGTTKRIKDIKVGNKVLATDPTTGKTFARTVTHLHLHQDTDLADVTIVDRYGGRTTLHTTQHHPFWDNTRNMWVDAVELRPGDQLHSSDSEDITVAGVVSFLESQAMYNLTVDTTHTYYVMAGSTPVLVHNDSCSVVDVTTGGSVRNIGTNTTHGEFADTLTSGGWTSRTSADGKVQIFEKDGARYVLREKADSYGGWTADFTPAGASSVTLKIRLGYPS